MKSIFYILLSSLLLMAACSKDESYPFAEERRSLTDSTRIGFYKEGKALLHLDQEAHQYYCSPSEFIYRIQTNDGKERTTLRLSNIPTEKQKANGRIEGNMGVEMGEVRNLYVLKRNGENVWLWSDEDRVAVILPNLGF